MSPSVLGLVDRFGEVRREQQVLEVRIGVERFFDAIEEHRPNDAAAAPQEGAIAEIQRPAKFLRRCLKLNESLGVAANLRGVKGVANLLDERLLVARILL